MMTTAVRVDQMLEHARPRDRAFLGDVADDDDGRAAALGKTHEFGRALAQLRHAARARGDRRGLHGLDRIDDQQRRARVARGRDDRIEIGFGEHPQRRARDAEAPGAQRNLRRGFLATGIDDRHGARRRRGHLQQQRRLADAGVAAQQRDAALHDAATEHPIKFGEPAAGPTRLGLRIERARLAGRRARSRGAGPGGARPGGGLERVPLGALRALTLPFGRLGTASAADEDGDGTGHGASQKNGAAMLACNSENAGGTIGRKSRQTVTPDSGRPVPRC